MADIETIADELRTYWQLGTNPLPQLIDLLESKGILVIVTDVLDSKHKTAFDGLQAEINGLPIIVVSANWTGDRQRFTLAHELGHLILHNRLPNHVDEEKACNRFASAFLLPKNGLIEHLGATRKTISPRELSYLKHEYGISMQACLYRSKDLGIISENKYRSLMIQFSKQGWRKKEPDTPYPKEQTYLFAQLVHRALSEGVLTESKSAELLNMSVFKLRQQRFMQTI
ncbi:MAG: ImmA/IrrE family metallo-endopeptidase [Moraxellaceae bacterium]|nr:ImmA/IrrE family metallo-endopeptidase [Moraxellaceae bacterium]